MIDSGQLHRSLSSALRCELGQCVSGVNLDVHDARNQSENSDKKKLTNHIWTIWSHNHQFFSLSEVSDRFLSWTQYLRSESDYALKNEIEDWKIKFWLIRTKGAKISLSSLMKFQSLIFNLNLQCIVWFQPYTAHWRWWPQFLKY